MFASGVGQTYFVPFVLFEFCTTWIYLFLIKFIEKVKNKPHLFKMHNAVSCEKLYTFVKPSAQSFVSHSPQILHAPLLSTPRSLPWHSQPPNYFLWLEVSFHSLWMNHTVCTLVSGFCTLHNDFEILSCCSRYQQLAPGWKSIVWLHHILFSKLPVEEHLGCLQFGLCVSCCC